MYFWQTDWFAWVVSIVIIGGLLVTWWESLDDSGHLETLGYLIKEAFLFIIGLILLPFITVYHIFSEKK